MVQGWETQIGQALVNLIGNAACAGNNPLAQLFYNGNNCGYYLLGIMLFLVFAAYVVLMNLGVDAMVLVFTLLFLLMYSWGLIPTGILYVVALMLAWLVYNFWKGFDFAK